MNRIKCALLLLLLLLPTLTGCGKNDADVASENLSTAADNFEIDRRVIFYNGITGEYILVIEGRCSLGNKDTIKRMSVTCKTGPGTFKKHMLGLSDNVTFFAEQLEPSPASTYRYRVSFKPTVLIPAVDLR